MNDMLKQRAVYHFHKNIYTVTASVKEKSAILDGLKEELGQQKVAVYHFNIIRNAVNDGVNNTEEMIRVEIKA